MDSDLQHPPEMIPLLLAKAREGNDVVTAVRRSEDVEGWFKVSSARFFYSLLNRLTALDLPHGGADFRYMARPVVDSMLRMPERHRFVRGLTRWVGFQQTTIEYDRAPRHGGRSKYTLRHMTRFAFDAIVAFSAVPLKVASVLGLVVSMLGGLYGLYVVGVWLLSDTVVPGWTSVAIAVIVLGGVQLACLGIIGTYLGRMYEEMKGRPLFIVWEDTRAGGPASRTADHTARRPGVTRAAFANPPVITVSPARVVMDAAAVAVATAIAFVFRAGVRDYDSLGPGHLLSLILPALVFVIPVSLFALWSVGAYGTRAAQRLDRFFVVASGLAWAAVPLAFVAVYWRRGPEAPMIVMAAGYPAAVACVLAGRRLLDARAPATVRA